MADPHVPVAEAGVTDRMLVPAVANKKAALANV
jgi:hypothetical protein